MRGCKGIDKMLYSWDNPEPLITPMNSNHITTLAAAAMTYKWRGLPLSHSVRGQNGIDNKALITLNLGSPEVQIVAMAKLMEDLNPRQREWVAHQVRAHYTIPVSDLPESKLTAAFAEIRAMNSDTSVGEIHPSTKSYTITPEDEEEVEKKLEATRLCA